MFYMIILWRHLIMDWMNAVKRVIRNSIKVKEMFGHRILEINKLIWCNISDINASLMKYETHVCFNSQN